MMRVAPMLDPHVNWDCFHLRAFQHDSQSVKEAGRYVLALCLLVTEEKHFVCWHNWCH